MCVSHLTLRQSILSLHEAAGTNKTHQQCHSLHFLWSRALKAYTSRVHRGIMLLFFCDWEKRYASSFICTSFKTRNELSLHANNYTLAQRASLLHFSYGYVCVCVCAICQVKHLIHSDTRDQRQGGVRVYYILRCRSLWGTYNYMQGARRDREAAVGRGEEVRARSITGTASSFGVALVDRPNWPISRIQQFTSWPLCHTDISRLLH